MILWLNLVTVFAGITITIVRFTKIKNKLIIALYYNFNSVDFKKTLLLKSKNLSIIIYGIAETVLRLYQ